MSVQKTAEGTWLVRYLDTDRRHRSKTFKKKAEANAFDRDIKQKKYEGEKIEPDKQNMLVGEFFEQRFLKRRVAGSTKEIWEQNWGLKDPKDDQVWHLRKTFAKRRLGVVNARDIAVDWIAEMEDAGATPAKMFQAISLLVGIISYAVELEYLNRNRLSGIQREIDYQPADTGTPWLPEQVELLRSRLLWEAENAPRGKVAREYQWRRWRDATIVSVLSYQPLREGEGLALQWPMVLDESGKGIRQWVEITSRVPRSKIDPEDRTKTSRTRSQPRAYRKPRDVEFCEATRRDLRWWWMACGQPTSGYVFPRGIDNPERWDRNYIGAWTKHSWNRPIQEVGLDRYPPKHMRLSAVSMMVLEAKLNDSEIAHQAGHSVATMYRTYDKAYRLRRDRDVPFVMAEAIEQARRGPEPTTLRAVAGGS